MQTQAKERQHRRRGAETPGKFGREGNHSPSANDAPETRGQTGVEMEALCALQVALLTIYDMCKAVDRGMVISDVQLEHKSGGKSGEWNRAQ